VPLRPRFVEARLGCVGEKRPLDIALSSRVVPRLDFEGVGTCSVCRWRRDVEAGASCEKALEVVGVLGPGVAEALSAGGDENREVLAVGASRVAVVPLVRGADLGADSTPLPTSLVV